jgi:hypothetical protein
MSFQDFFFFFFYLDKNALKKKLTCYCLFQMKWRDPYRGSWAVAV